MKNIILLKLILISAISYSQNWNPKIIEQPVQGASHHFGNSVSIDGDYAVVGAPNENDQTGAANVFKKDGNGDWNHIQKITAFVGLSIDEYFGTTVHIKGDFIFISSPTDRLNEDRFEEPAGSVLIYKNNGADNFVGIQRIRSSDISLGDFFGVSIDSHGDYLVVGAPSEDHDLAGGNALASAGAAYIFKKDMNDSWNQTQKLIPSHRASSNRIGYNIAIYGDYILLGSQNNTDVDNLNPVNGNGAAFVFKKDIGDNWNEIQKLKPSISQSGSLFGHDGIDIDGDYIAVGARSSKNTLNETTGSVYIFKVNNDGNSWVQTQKIEITENRGTIDLGENLALKNNYLIACAPSDYMTVNGQNISGTGSAYFFELNNNIWTERFRIESPEPELNASFGGSNFIATFQSNSTVAFNATNFIIGTHLKDDVVGVNNLFDVGKAYISDDINTFIGQTITWTGAVSTDWNTPGNWDTNSVPTATDDVILADVANAPRVNFNQSHAVNDLTINENLTIKTNAGLTVNGNLDQAANIQVESFVTGNGSFILRGNQTNLNPADIIYLRYISGNNWHLFSSPATGMDIDALAAATQLAEGQNNNRGIGFYDNNANPRWSYYQDGANDTGDFIAGKGYSLRTSANAFLILTGKLKATDLSNYIITENLNSWNLVGNPYPAFINANVNADANENFLSENADQLDPAFANIYLWNPSTTSYEPVGNGLGARYIAPGQGFFVKSKNGGGTIDINKTMLTHQIGNLFLKQNQPQKIVLTIDDKTSISETTIAFKESMTKGLDITYDAAVFSGESRNLSLYTHLLENNENVSFAIQFLPKLENNEFVIPVGVSKNENSEITFSLQESTISSDVNIYLEDKLENTFTEISKTPNYTFSHQKATNEIGRFYLHIQKNTLSLENVQKENITIYKDSASSILINGVADGTLNIYSITGENVMKNRKINENEKRIQLPTLAKGIYLFEVKTSSRKIIKKIIF